MVMTVKEKNQMLALELQVKHLTDIIRAVGEPNKIVARTGYNGIGDIGLPDMGVVRFILGEAYENYVDVSIDQQNRRGDLLLIRAGRLCSIRPQAANTFLVRVEDN